MSDTASIEVTRSGTERAESGGDASSSVTAGPKTTRVADEPSLNEIFNILSNQRRRQTLRYLSDKDEETASIGELSEQIAAGENEKPVGELTSQERKRVYVALYQVHLPKMANVGVIEYDDDRGVITSGPAAENFRQYLTTAYGESQDAPDWERHYLLVAAGGALLWAVSQFGAAAVGLSLQVVLGVILVAVGGFPLVRNTVGN